MSSLQNQAPQASNTQADGTLLGLLTALLYVVFTLLPSSHSLMVSWPWVFVWQVALALPILWLLWQLWFKPLGRFRLGAGLDWAAVLLAVGLLVSTLFAEFRQQALWYSWAALGGIAAVYALSGWLTSAQRALRLLQFQAGLSVVFVLESLGLWLFQTYLPELARLEALAPYGVAQRFDFGITSLRNWYPLGHQNYVAGYLVLVLPLFVGLAVTGKGWQRWLWGAAACLGLADLYTTSSRGGSLALVGMVAVALLVAVWRSQLPRRWVIPGGIALLGAALALTLANSRVRAPLFALLRGNVGSSELAYRVITNTIGWRIGLDHPFTGAGPGSVLLLWQKYRPYWAGREAELHFQVHSTPAQVWAELGLWGIAAGLLGLALLVRLGWQLLFDRAAPMPSPLPSPVLGALLVGLLGFLVVGLTDYQLDNLAIAGAIAIYLTTLCQAVSTGAKDCVPAPQRRLERSLTLMGLGLVLAVSLWLIPVHRAWAASSGAFQALQAEDPDLETFTSQLRQAQALAPWEPYYPYQLGWQLGELSLQNPDAPEADDWRTAAIAAFQAGNRVSPYSEFGRSNLGWLLLSRDPAAAQAAFAEAARLVPAKAGVFLGLGFSLARLNQPELATAALTLEALRHPLLIPSGIWQFPQVAPLYDAVLEGAIATCTSLLSDSSAPALTNHLRQLRGSLYWWQGNFAAAEADWQQGDLAIGPALLALSQDLPLPDDFSQLPDDPATLAIQAWQQPERRQQLIEQALITLPTDLPQLGIGVTAEQMEQLLTSMETAQTFNDWLKRTAPISQPRNERLGFGALSRHIDGVSPRDYLPRLENLPIEKFFEELFPSPAYLPDWDAALQPLRDKFL